jgi:hypothetical protein
MNLNDSKAEADTSKYVFWETCFDIRRAIVLVYVAD